MFVVIEIAVGEYDIDQSKMMAAAVKKFHEERDTYYLGTYKRDNFIRADSGMCQHDQQFIVLITILIRIVDMNTIGCHHN